MDCNKPIGVFDSGVGGLTVWRELIKMLPSESVVYYADNGNYPYGPKAKNEIVDVVSNVVNFLLTKKCKLIIVACNTATAAAIDYLRDNYNIPFVGMEPAVKPAALNSKTKSIAVLATEGTFNGKLYIDTSKKYAQDVVLNIKVGDKLVDIVENGLINEESSKLHIANLLKPLIDKNIDHLVLGCTHYPFLTEVLKEVLPENVIIVDPAPAVVNQVKRILKQNNIFNNELSKPEYEFYYSGKKEVLVNLLKNITDVKFSIEKV